MLTLVSGELFAQSSGKDLQPFEPLRFTRTLVHDQTPAEQLAIADDIRIDGAGNFYIAAATKTHPCWFTSSDHGKVELDTIERWGNDLFDARFLYLQYPDQLYFKTFYGTKVYGPFQKRISMRAFSNRNDENIGFMIIGKDSIYQYINDSLVSTLHRLEALTRDGRYPHWFQNNGAGDYAFFVRREGKDYLYRGRKLLDTAYEISDLQMYEDGTCRWVSRANANASKAEFNNDRGIKKTIQRPGSRKLLLKDSVYSLQGCSEFIMGTANMEVAGHDGGFENFEEQITLAESRTYPPNGNHYLAECPIMDSLNNLRYFAHVDGQQQPGLFSKILLPAIDAQGNYSFWGLRNEAVFAVINGKVEEVPDLPRPTQVTRYTPIYIAPDGSDRWYYSFANGKRNPNTLERLTPDTCQLIHNKRVVRKIITEERDYMVMRSGYYEFSNT